MNPMVFWIVATPRSGSNFVAGEIWRGLGGEPKPMEYFNPDSVRHRPDFVPRPGAPVQSYLEYLQARESLHGVLGVKLLFGQVKACRTYPDFMSALRSGPIIHLQRKDAIRQGISLYLLRQTRQWASFAEPRGAAPHDVPYDYGAIAGQIEYLEMANAGMRRFIRVNALDVLPVWYEDVVANPDTEVARVLAYLGLARTTVPLSDGDIFRRQAPDVTGMFYERFLADDAARWHEVTETPGGPLYVNAEPCTSADGPQ